MKPMKNGSFEAFTGLMLLMFLMVKSS